MQSSITGFVQNGYDFEGLPSTIGSQLAAPISDPSTMPSLATQLLNVNAITPGMFNIPVCVMCNLVYWPTIYSQSNSQPNGDQLCQCNTPWSVDPAGVKFNQSASPMLTDLSWNAYNEGGYQLHCNPDQWGATAPGATQDEMTPTLGGL